MTIVYLFKGATQKKHCTFFLITHPNVVPEWSDRFGTQRHHCWKYARRLHTAFKSFVPFRATYKTYPASSASADLCWQIFSDIIYRFLIQNVIQIVCFWCVFTSHSFKRVKSQIAFTRYYGILWYAWSFARVLGDCARFHSYVMVCWIQITFEGVFYFTSRSAWYVDFLEFTNRFDIVRFHTVFRFLRCTEVNLISCAWGLNGPWHSVEYLFGPV